MAVTWWELGLRLAAAALLGTCIGLERQWRARMAGLRTNALVATGAALFVLLSTVTSGDASPTRIAAQVVSGIGFLGAGVIIRDGGTLRGINTAATIWGSAAVGCLAAAGQFGLAAAGTGAIVAINLMLRPVARGIDHRASRRGANQRSYLLQARCQDSDEASVRALLVQHLTVSGFGLTALRSRELEGTDRIEITTELRGRGIAGAQLEQAVGRLALEPGIHSVSWRQLTAVVDDEDDDDES